jgi:protein phosphatase
VAFVVVLLAVLGVGAYLVNDYATNTYFVTVDDGEVTIFRGRPGGVLWIDPELVERTGIDADDVPDEFVADVREGVDRSSLAAARRYAEGIEDRIEELAPPPTTTTTTTSSTTTTAPAPTSTP